MHLVSTGIEIWEVAMSHHRDQALPDSPWRQRSRVVHPGHSSLHPHRHHVHGPDCYYCSASHDNHYHDQSPGHSDHPCGGTEPLATWPQPHQGAGQLQVSAAFSTSSTQTFSK
uniref:Uncharacterized protein n=1 Tax=Timema douglasi TaxID=61478 RepID=A0A7R8VVI1_TIMDO|nr:unnamed protein product [Timema douglasi]